MSSIIVFVRGDVPTDGFHALNCFFQPQVRRTGPPAGRTSYVLQFPAPLRTPLVSEIYASLPEVESAGPNRVIGTTDFVAVTTATDRGPFLYTISHGWGDCLAGCIHRTTWLFAVSFDGEPTLIRRYDR
jgi:hypothetical protein